MYKETRVLDQLIKAISNLQYPKEHLFALILLEEDDKDTINKIQQINLPFFINYVIVPHSQPKTKPKACNYGLQFLKHCDYITIFDAEDIPETDQLLKSVVHFYNAPKEVVCIQASLCYRNKNENLLASLFYIEYKTWFNLFLHGLSELNLPLPLGGTSNHFRTEKLLELGGWDAYNVTEDADLGLKIYEKGWRIQKLDSITWEEAVLRHWPWIKQRTRWMKGYIQTYVNHQKKQHIKQPLTHKISNFLFILGTPFVGLWTIPLYVITIMSYFWDILDLNGIHGILALVSLVFGNLSMILSSMMAVRKEPKFILISLLLPIYWILHSIASWRALIQYFTNPYKWEKTEHGLTKEHI